MKTKKELTCIGCPMGCLLSVDIEDGILTDISGHTCPRGKEYAEKELTHPERTITSTVAVVDGMVHMAPVRTEHDIPKDKIYESMALIHKTHLHAPVRTGEVVIENIADTGVNLIATRSVAARNPL